MTGLLPDVVKALLRLKISHEIIDQRSPLRAVNVPDIIPLHDPNGGYITLYDYQVRVVRDFFAIGNGRGIAKLATGGGKTEAAIALTFLIKKPTLFLTHRKNLLRQTAKRFADRIPELKNHIGMVGDGSHDFKAITIATVQTLQNMIKRNLKETAGILAQFQFMIIDEAHRSGASQFYDVANLCVNANMRLALTATPFMRENSADDLCLLGLTGPIFTSVTNEELIERGIMAKPFFSFIEIDQPANLHTLKNWHDIYDHGIVFNGYRNNVIAIQAKRLIGMGKKTLCIVERVPHGKALERLMADRGIRARFVSGKIKTSLREQALSDLAKGSIDILISTNIFDEGIDVKEIDAVIFAAGNKNPVAFFQRTGRATRKKQKNNYAIIIDFIDRQHDTLYKHSCTRYGYVKNEKGFVILSATHC